jgi:acyl-CoA oxidase
MNPSDRRTSDSLAVHLAGPHADVRRKVLELLQTPAFHIPLEIDRAEHRARVLEALKVLAAEGLGRLAYPEAYGGEGAPGRAIAVFETLAFGDSSILIKFGVQFGLWGGSVYQLGTEKHHERWLRDIGTLELPGCYAMTEIGHGSNVRGLETVARWDEGEGAFVLHTPHEGAGKEWIGNAALHGRMATVFTQLRVGGEDHGVHALVVPIRDEDGVLLPGIRIEDNGPKVGLNGIDNGRIWFDQVRVPRENLLDRFASVTEDGRYESPIDSAGRRFFTMLGTLVAGRISIAAGSVSVAKVGLAVAVRYSEERRQFGPEGGPEVPILDYPSHQRRLLPRVAETYALHFAVRDLAERYAAVVKGRAGDRPGHGGTGADADADAASADTAGADAAEPGSRPEGRSEEALREVEARAAGLKALASWHAARALQESREAMGGRGYHAGNRIGRLRADTDVFATFEGANPVLLQLVAKSLLTQYREEMGDLSALDIVRYVADRAGTRVRERNPVATRRTDSEHLRDSGYHLQAFEYRAERMLESAARRLKAFMDDGIDAFEAFNRVQDHLETLAVAHTEWVALQAFLDGVDAAPEDVRPLLADVARLYALERMEADRAWFLEAGYVESAKSRAIRAEVGALCRELREVAVELVDGWGIPDGVLGAVDVVG